MVDVEQHPVTAQPASLYLLGQAALNCTIISISPTGIAVTVDPATPLPALNRGDLAEVHVSSFAHLKIRTAIDTISSKALQLNFINAKDSSVRQLVSWFGQKAATTTVSIPPTEGVIINELTEIILKHITELFDVFLQEADSSLLSMAEVVDNNDQQNKLFEAKSLLRQKGDRINLLHNQLLKFRIENFIDNKPGDAADSDSNLYEEMELIDLEEFEDWLSIDTIIRRGNEKNYQSLACLEKRYAKLLKKSVDTDTLPPGVHNICNALQDTFKQHKISPELLPLTYKIFEETVIDRLGNLYDILNSKLKSYGVLPNIESHILQQPRKNPSRRTTDSPRIAAPEDSNTDENQQPVEVQTESELFASAKNILSLLQPQQNTVNAPSNTTAATSTSTLIENLSSLQQDSTASQALPANATLSQWLQQDAGLVLANETQELMSLVESIFQNITHYSQISQPLISQMKRLEIPVAKAALMDNDFFSGSSHPAQQLLNQLINLCLNSDMPNQSLERKFNSVISDVTNNFQQDPQVFTQAIDELTTIEKQQQNAYQRNTDRIIQTYDGRQRVKQAQDAVERELQRRVSPPQAPAVIIDLIENGWRELLKLTFIKEGKNSDAWQEQLATLDQLLQWITDNESDESPNAPDIERELEADSFADLIGQQLHNIFPGDYRYQSTVENIRDILKGLQPIVNVPLSSDVEISNSNHSELHKELEAANPQLSRWFKRAKSLKVGDEFSYLGDDTGQRNIKLAWISDNQQNFVFVNNRGQKVLDFDLVDLASELAKGLSPSGENSEWPLVERSLYSSVQDAYEKLAFNSCHDELTGLINRKESERVLGTTLLDAKNNLNTHHLLYLDIDKFSLINNLYGHVAGDQLLVDLSQFLINKLPQDTVVARMAGNEFVILLNNTDQAQGKSLAENIRHEIEQHTFHWQEHPLQITSSIGMMVINKYTENVVDLLRSAVTAAQTAKDQGGNRTHDFRQDAEQHERREKLLSWIDQLSNVLESDKLCLRGQQISASSGQDKEPHYEILLAIKDDNGNLTSPIEFIEAAECYNRMQRVDRWVIEQAFRWLSSLAENNITLPSISINLSGNSMNDDQFMDYILEKFAQFKVPTNKICFEVTETATINNLSEAADFIREIKKLGCKSSLDDFGSGNASYQYLKHLPVDYLKIDGMFVKDIHTNADDFALVKSIHEIAHLMGKQTIAEYAESKEVIALLQEIGVDYLQGFAVSKPRLLADIADNLAQNS
ncbi:DUF1631 family protein [Oceanicoccus sagamiensis]|uniref:Diguanylate cyclase n=1 Tax=Oceanicoccus sagamiensis TaxID=716816 RepID=A0A1X9NCN9_9GAMM|nr:DUF1631 family protein [Oceanicoccus sagamiensis]ARN75336.1 hypothetical protein BST96_15180 [Oceanicoccus sagamiensis]